VERGDKGGCEGDSGFSGKGMGGVVGRKGYKCVLRMQHVQETEPKKGLGLAVNYSQGIAMCSFGIVYSPIEHNGPGGNPRCLLGTALGASFPTPLPGQKLRRAVEQAMEPGRWDYP
jgi:hypothetical protein